MLANEINPNGCFDWVGYTNPDEEDVFLYATKDAPQMKATYRMIMRTSGQDATTTSTTESNGVNYRGEIWIITFSTFALASMKLLI